jgi:hypothetical protein
MALREVSAGDPVTTAAIVDSTNPWMTTATAIATSRLPGIELAALPTDRAQAASHQLDSRRCVLLVDVVNTGATLKRAIESCRSLGIILARRPLVAIASNDRPQIAETECEVLDEVEVTRIPRKDCPQCALNIPFGDQAMWREPQATIGAFAFWDMVLSSRWSKERWGPPRPRLDYVPDFDKLFQEFGDFIAYKLESVLKNQLHVQKEVVLALPAETYHCGSVGLPRGEPGGMCSLRVGVNPAVQGTRS